MNNNQTFDLILVFLSASILLFGHILRTFRWRMVLGSANIYVSNRKPLLALTVGYNIGIFTPLFVGDLIRSFFLATLERIDPVLTLASVVYERTIDLVIVTSILVIVAINFNSSEGLPTRFLFLIIFIFSFLYLINRSKSFRRAFWGITKIFNSGLKTTLLHFIWNLASIFNNRTLNRNGNFWLLTLLMWASYLTSLYLFCLGIGVPYEVIFTAIYGEPGLQSFLSIVTKAASVAVAPLVIYLVLPPLLVTVFVILRAKPKLISGNSMNQISSFTNFFVDTVNRNSPNFAYEQDYVNFLESKFSGDKSLKSIFIGEGLEGINVLRIFHGGSTAVTALLETKEDVVVRKFAAKDVKNNLAKQVGWYKDISNDLPIVKLKSEIMTNSNGIYYDMEFNKTSRDFFDVIKTEDNEFVNTIFKNILSSMRAFHENNRISQTSLNNVSDYYNIKVFKNVEILRKANSEFFENSNLSINEKIWKASYLEPIINKDLFSSFIKSKWQHKIHGDLTIENILIDLSEKNKEQSWFLIDPNPADIFSTSLNDYSKLFQSLHLGYEAINRKNFYMHNGNSINILVDQIPEYTQLYLELIEFIRVNFHEDALRETYLHEIVDYLRLIPYQYRKGQNQGDSFMACLALLLIEFNEKYLN